jgi:hypothetical protein
MQVQVWNRRGLTRSAAHICRDCWYKRHAKSSGIPGEKSEEAIVLLTVKTT